ncbi:MAG: hypothetical protein DRI65_10180, partial [Chloroflexota bacterium]
PRFSWGDMTSTGSDGKQYRMFCLPLDEIGAWLYGINSRKVKESVAPNLLRYQRHVMTYIDSYFTNSITHELVQELRDIVERLTAENVSLRKENDSLRISRGLPPRRLAPRAPSVR